MTTAPAVPSRRDIQMVIAASSLGTIFEWYDFYIYGTLAVLFGKLFFPAASETAGLLLALATFGVGFAVRPVGAVIFGVLGDRFGRKYTFLVTITLMGLATAAIGLVPSVGKIGIWAPILLVALRAVQGLAVGGEYGGASIYVAEHAPANRRGFFTSFIQTGASGGLLLSLVVIAATSALVGDSAWKAWGWRIPFVLSLFLLGISLWIRLRLAESPVFQAMRAAGEVSRHPLRESLNSWRKVKRILAAMFGISVGQAVIGYTAMFQTLYFLQNAQHLEPNVARVIMILGTGLTLGAFVLFGALSDRVGRKPMMLVGCAFAALAMLPLFHFMASQANPALAAAMRANPVVVAGTECSFNPFAQHGQATACGKVLDVLSKTGVAYTKVEGAPGSAPIVTIGGHQIEARDPSALQAGLSQAGYRLGVVTPPMRNVALIVLALAALYVISAMSYGPVAAWLVELFPSRVRYTSMSIPYHVGTGYAGGFLPFIAQLIIAKTGDPFAGFWYPIGAAMLAFAVIALFLPETAGRPLDCDD